MKTLIFSVVLGGLLPCPVYSQGGWVQQNDTTTLGAFRCVRFVDSELGWTVGDYGVILQTTDGGETWNPQTSGTSQHLYSADFVSSQVGWCCGIGGVILHTTDGGITWSPQANGTSEPLFSIFFIDELDGWASGGQSTILRTTNGGTTWTGLQIGADNINAIHFANQDIGGAVDNSWYAPGILHSTNGGTTWYHQDSGTSESLNSIYWADVDTGWVVGHNGTILHTTNGGTTWNFQSSTTTSWLVSVRFVGTNVGWAVGDGGVILHTTNGGTTWNQQESGITNWLRSVFFVDEFEGWVVSSQGYILHTTAGGEPLLPSRVLLVYPEEGAIVTADSVQLVWERSQSEVDRYWLEEDTDSLFSNPFIDSLATDTTYAIAGLQHDTTYWWRVRAHNSYGWGQFSAVRSFFVYQEIPDAPLLLSPDSGAVGRSTSPTLIWDASLGTEYYGLQLSDMPDFSNLIVDNDSVGATSLQVTGLLYSVTYYWRVNATNALGVSDWSSIWNFSTLILDVTSQEKIPSEFSVGQNFPNPFNPSTTIRFSLPRLADVSLKIFNLLGEEVASLISGQMNAGSYSVHWDATDQPSGVYFWRIEAGDFTETRKLVLLR